MKLYMFAGSSSLLMSKHLAKRAEWMRGIRSEARVQAVSRAALVILLALPWQSALNPGLVSRRTTMANQNEWADFRGVRKSVLVIVSGNRSETVMVKFIHAA